MNTYFEQMVLGASPVELICLLYQRGIRSVREAREHLAAGRIAERSGSIAHAYLVVAELLASLNRDEAPELAMRLGSLYSYIQERLLEANLKQVDGPLAEVLSLMTTLSEGWHSAPEPQAGKRAGAWMGVDRPTESERLVFSA